MTHMSGVFRKLLSDNSYCCLCFQTIEEKLNTLQDEVIFDSKNAVDLYEILTTMLGNLVPDCLATNTICHKCTETAISSYKFIQICKSNVQNLANNILCLQKYTENVIENKECEKTLFLALDLHNYTINSIYDRKQRYRSESSLIRRFNYLASTPSIKNVCNFITVEIDPESDHSFENDFINKNKDIPLAHIIMPNEKDENNFNCKNCVKVFPTVLKLKQHYSRVHAPKEFKCSKCPRSFGSMLLLNRHSKDSHCTVVCSQCGKTYNNTYSLRHHERSHKVRLICQTCGKIYKGKQSFNNHIEQKLCEKMRKSNSEAKFACNYCDKKYSQKTALSVHIRLEHENGKALTCEWCNKKLSSISRLKDHIIKHTKQKNFNCDICGGKFVTKASLLYHTRIHSGEKPYHCDHCDMQFLSASRRSEHVKRHHTQPDLECDICHSKFRGQTCLKRHRKRHFDTSSRLFSSIPKQVEDAVTTFSR